MNSGNFRTPIEFYTETKTADGYGGYTSAWTLGSSDWCSIKQLQGRRGYEFQEVTGHSGYEIVLNYNPSFIPTKEMKAVVNGKNLVIHSINNVRETNWYNVILAYWKDND